MSLKLKNGIIDMCYVYKYSPALNSVQEITIIFHNEKCHGSYATNQYRIRR
jgi:hypothetical protein